MNVNLLYTSKVITANIIDGDTVECMVDLTHDTMRREKYRLALIDAWDKSDGIEKQQAAKAAFEQYCKDGVDLYVITIKDKREKYGRYLALFYNINPFEIEAEHLIDASINNKLLIDGHAVRY